MKTTITKILLTIFSVITISTIQSAGYGALCKNGPIAYGTTKEDVVNQCRNWGGIGGWGILTREQLDKNLNDLYN